jgi:predicted GNAT family acetyltransferase
VAAQVRDNPDQHRYEIHLDDVLVGFVAYRQSDGVRVLVHAEIQPEYEGRGLGSTLARGALDDVRTRGLRMVPSCPFIAAYLRRHPEYADLAAAEPTEHP